MPTFLLIGSDVRLPLIEDLAAIAELDPQDADGVRFFEATAWQSQVLRVETPITRNLDVIAARSAVADFLILTIADADGPMQPDLIELEASPERVELSMVYLAATVPPLHPELRELVKFEVTELIRRKRPRWSPRFHTENCDTFFHLLKRSFFSDCL
jgi:hypothetical protein